MTVEIFVGKRIKDAVEELEKEGYSEIDAIRIIHNNYEVDSLDPISTLTHFASIVLIVSLFINSPILDAFKITLGTLYSIFLVGYVILHTFYRNGLKDVSNLSMIGLSLGVSFASIALIGFLLNFTIGINPFTVIISVVSITEILNTINNIIWWLRKNEL
jgi:uncharacterized membrane protein